MKKMIAVLLVLCMALALGACNAPADDGKIQVGICQLAQHAALDAATKGFQDALTAAFGDKVEFDVQNASGDSNNCTVIMDSFVSNKVDLIMANATGALQAAASATKTIPVLGTSVTDYASALEIENWTGTVGTNISGWRRWISRLL